MNLIVNMQTLLFLTCIEIGVILGMMYDLIRIFRKIIPHPNWLVQVEDIFYWLIGALVGFAVLYMHNYGEIRLFVFLGMILGGVLYLCTLSVVFMKFATCLIELIKRVVSWLIHIISIPIKWFIHILLIPLKMVKDFISTLLDMEKREVKKFKRKWYYKRSDIKTKIKLNKTK